MKSKRSLFTHLHAIALMYDSLSMIHILICTRNRIKCRYLLTENLDMRRCFSVVCSWEKNRCLIHEWILLSQTFLMNQFIQFTNVLLKLTGRERYQCNSTKCSLFFKQSVYRYIKKKTITWKSSIFLVIHFRKWNPYLFYILYFILCIIMEAHFRHWRKYKKRKMWHFLSQFWLFLEFISCHSVFTSHNSVFITSNVSLYDTIQRKKK